MSTNTNVPFSWDTENDNALFGSLFPDGLNAPDFGTVFSNTSPYASKKRNAFSNSPLSKNGNDVRDGFFSNSKIHTYNNFEVIVDPSSGINPADKIKTIEGYFYWNTNGSDSFGDTVNGVADKYAFTVKLFISKIAGELEALYNDEKVKPEAKEILLFLEDNKGDLSKATLFIKLGDDVKDFKFIDATMANNVRFSNFIQKEYNISTSTLKELLRTGKVSNLGLDIISCLFDIASFAISDPHLLKGAALGIELLNKKIRDFCSIKETDWNPGKKEENTAFEPFFFPGSNASMDLLDDKEINDATRKMIAQFEEKVKFYDSKILSMLNSNIGVVPIPVLFMPGTFVKVDLIPERFEELLSYKYKELSSKMHEILNQLSTFDLSTILKKGINALNAFLCGIWNGFIEAVCGIISLIQYLFEGASHIADLLENFKEKGPMILEKIDDCILAFVNLDFGKIFANLASNVAKWATSESTTSLEEIAYFSGMFIGFVVELTVEIVIGILFTGGVLTVEAIVAKVGQAFKALGSLLLGIVKLPVSLAGKTISGFMQALHWLYEFLSKGTDEIVRIIDEVFAKMKKVADEVFQQARNLQKGAGNLNKSFFENAGVKIERFISEVKVIGQTSDNTCVATSLRMVLENKGILRTEEELARVLKTDHNGASILDIPEALYQKRIDEVITVSEKKINLTKLLKALGEGDKAIVSVGTKKFGNHALVLEKIEHGKVCLIDPLPISNGASYKITLEDFELLFRERAVIIKK